VVSGRFAAVGDWLFCDLPAAGTTCELSKGSASSSSSSEEDDLEERLIEAPSMLSGDPPRIFYCFYGCTFEVCVFATFTEFYPVVMYLGPLGTRTTPGGCLLFCVTLAVCIRRCFS
jgi:hypothetical protein